MAKTIALTSRIDNEILGMAEAILNAHGLTAQDYVRMAIARLVNQGGIPWNTVEHDKAVAGIKRQRRQQRKNALQEAKRQTSKHPSTTDTAPQRASEGI